MPFTRLIAVLLMLHVVGLVCASCNKQADKPAADDRPTAQKAPLRDRFATLQELAAIPVPTGYPGRGFAISPDGKELAIGGSDGSVMLVPTEPDDAPAKVLIGHTEMVLEAAYTPDGKHLITGGADNKLFIWNRHSATVTHEISAHKGDVKALATSSDGSLVATGSVADDVRVWNVTTGKRMQHFEGHSSTVYAVLFSPNGQHVYSGARDSQVRRWSLEKGKGDAAPVSFRQTVVSLRWTPDHKSLIMAGLVGELAWIDPTRFRAVHRRRVAHRRVADMDVAADGTIAIGDQSGRLSFWSPNPKQAEPLVPAFQAHPGEILQVAFIPRTSTLLTLGADLTIRRWDAKTGEAIGTPRGLPAINGRVRAVAAHPTTGQAAIASRGRLFLVDGATPKKAAQTPDVGPGGLSALRYSPDGTRLLLGRDNGHIAIRDVAEPTKVIKDVGVHAGTVRHMVFTADGESLWTAGDDIAVYHLDPNTLKPRLTITDHTSPIVALAIDPAGKRLASTEEDHITFIRYADSNTLQWTRRGHHITHLEFDPTGDVLAMVEARRIVMLYDVEQRRELKKLKGNASRIQGIAFHPDGEVLVTIDAHGGVRAWSVADGANLANADAGRGRPTGMGLGQGGRLVISGGMDPRGSAKLFRLGPLSP